MGQKDGAGLAFRLRPRTGLYSSTHRSVARTQAHSLNAVSRQAEQWSSACTFRETDLHWAHSQPLP